MGNSFINSDEYLLINILNGWEEGIIEIIIKVLK